MLHSKRISNFFYNRTMKHRLECDGRNIEYTSYILSAIIKKTGRTSSCFLIIHLFESFIDYRSDINVYKLRCLHVKA